MTLVTNSLPSLYFRAVRQSRACRTVSQWYGSVPGVSRPSATPALSHAAARRSRSPVISCSSNCFSACSEAHTPTSSLVGPPMERNDVVARISRCSQLRR